MTEQEAQWAVVTYAIDAGLADVVSNLLATLNFHDFTISSRCDRKLDLVCYGRNGVLPQAVRDILAHLTISDEHIVGEFALIASADDSAGVELCPDVWIIPEEPAPYNEPQIPLYLGRGPAFGDGRHPTTRSAARLMRKLDWQNELVWDVGAGSGVLGLLAKRLGADTVIFGDIDEDALRTCRRSCQLNDYPDASILSCDLLNGFPTDQVPHTIIANIYAELVDDLLRSEALAKALPTGRLILSGISHHKADMIRSRLAQMNFQIIAEEQEEWWYAFHGVRLQGATP